MEKHALRIVEKLNKAGFVAYYAGGCVRDMVMGGVCKDIDIATNATPDEVIKLFSHTIPVGVKFGVVIVVLYGINYEVATFRTDMGYEDGRHPTSVEFRTPKEDALRRDFTINGMFYDPVKCELIDFVNGQKDINKGIIRAIGDPELRFHEDKLRMLRAVRFAIRFNFKIDKKTADAIKKNAYKITDVSFERIGDELIKIFTGPRRGKSLDLLHELGLLEQVLPEVVVMIGVNQPPEFHPEGDVFVHTKLVMDYLGDNPSPVLVFAGLLHDVGKPGTYVEADRIRFNCHDMVGAKIANKILRRLKFSNEDRKKVVLYIEEHMRIMNVQKMREGKLKKMLQRETIREELILHEADCLASHGIIDNKTFCDKKLKEYSKIQLKPKPLVTGKDLIAMELKPSPLFKKILNDIEDKQLENIIKTKKQALKYIKKEYL